MTLLVPDVGEVALLTNLLDNGNNWTLKLYKSDTTPAEGDVAGDYTECDFTDYAAKTLTRAVGAGNWGTPTTDGGTTYSEYNSGTPQTWTCGASGNTVYGYFVVDASTGTLIYAERFTNTRTLVSGDTLNLTPRIELA